jgi:hypothetical protein
MKSHPIQLEVSGPTGDVDPSRYRLLTSILCRSHIQCGQGDFHLLRAIAAALALVLLCYGLARAYLVHEITRAGQMLNDLEAVKIGDSEGSVLLISRKYDGYRWAPTMFSKLHENPDYEYVLEVDPWRFWHIDTETNHAGKLDRMIRTASTTVAPRVRRATGLRRWSVLGRISFRQNRVVAVTGTAVVEGRDEWLGGVWHLSETIPDEEIRRFVIDPAASWPQMHRYLMGGAYLNFSAADGGGESIESWITPSATHDEKQSASRFMFQCLTSRSGCRTICDFVPGALEYVRSRTWAEGRDACLAPRTYRF